MSQLRILALLSLITLSPALAQTTTGDERSTKAQTRARLAACGTEWQQMKRNGSDGALIWREFSATCMARRAKAASPADAATSSVGGRAQP